MHSVDPLKDHDPAAHVVHDVWLVASSILEYVPALHRVQELAMGPDQDPGVHAVQLAADVAPIVVEAVPAKQNEHADAPLAEYSPAPHS